MKLDWVSRHAFVCWLLNAHLTEVSRATDVTALGPRHFPALQLRNLRREVGCSCCQVGCFLVGWLVLAHLFTNIPRNVFAGLSLHLLANILGDLFADLGRDLVADLPLHLATLLPLLLLGNILAFLPSFLHTKHI